MTIRRITIAVLCLVLPSVPAWPEDSITRQEIDRLEQRVSELENKQQQMQSAESRTQLKIADKVSLGGVISGAYQYEWVNGPSNPGDRGRGALSIQPEVNITPTDIDTFHFKFGFAAGVGLPGVTAFNLSPWAADLEEDVKNINGRNRDYLLTAWYKHRFEFGDDHALDLTGGLIDATDYLDDNAYANDQYTQFMNEVLVNAPSSPLPSYDIGGAFQWEFRQFGINGVYMNVGKNEDDNNFNFFGAQFMYTLDTAFGEGHYRLVYGFTSEDFLDTSGSKAERRQIVVLSFDQALGSYLGGWIRLALQDDAAAVDYKELYSGGIHISGNRWNRNQDSAGIGYAYLPGAEQTPGSIRSSQVAEAYINIGLNDYLVATFDLQWVKDRYGPAASENNVDGWIAGIRATAAF